MKLGLRHKLLIAVQVYLVLLACVGLMGLHAAQVSIDRLHVVAEHHLREVSLVGDIASAVGVIHAVSLLHALSDSAEARQGYEEQIAQIESRVEALMEEFLRSEALLGDHDDIERMEAFRLAWNEFVQIQDGRFLPLSREARSREVFALGQPNGLLEQAYRDATAKLVSLRASLKSGAAEQLRDAEQDFSRNRDSLLWTVVLTVCFGISFGLVHSVKLARAVRAVSRAAGRVADGDFTQRLRVRTGDEIESLANSFNVMTENLQVMAETLNEQLRQVETANRALEAEVIERRRAEVAVRESEARFRSVTDSVNEAIISADSRGTIIFWNRGAQTIFGHREEDILGKPSTLLLPERYRHAFQAALERAELADPCEFIGKPIDQYGLRKDQTEFPLELSLATWTRGEETFFSGIIRDVTERREVDRMKNEFIAMVSHELRTPMNSVIGMADLLLSTDLAPHQLEYTQALQRSSAVLLGVINDILDFSKIEAGKLDLDINDFDLRDVVEDAAALVNEQAHGKGLEIACSIRPDVPGGLRGDPSRLRQVLLNLVDNAVRFTRTGAVVVRAVLAEQTHEAAVVRFEVVDTGIGITAEEQGRLFQPFTQAGRPSLGRLGGTGLGLAICKRLVELMGGEIGVESAPGHGTTFWFTVRFEKQAASTAPLAADAARAARQEWRYGLGRDPASMGPPPGAPRVLVAEDSPMSRHVALEMLRRLGFRADVVDNGYAVLEALSSRSYRAVLMDCQMPELDGFRAAAEIRRHEARESAVVPGQAPIPIIAMTASAMQGDRERCLAAGMNDYLPKPIRLHELAAMLGRWVGALDAAVLAAEQSDHTAARTPPSAHASGEAIDASALANLRRLQRAGQPDLVEALIALFREDAPQLVAALRAAAHRKDAEALWRIAHDFKADSATVGACEVEWVCAALERLGRRGTTFGALELLELLDTSLGRARAALDMAGSARGKA